MRCTPVFLLAGRCPDVKVGIATTLGHWLRQHHCRPESDLWVREDCWGMLHLGLGFASEAPLAELMAAFTPVATRYAMASWTIRRLVVDGADSPEEAANTQIARLLVAAR